MSTCVVRCIKAPSAYTEGFSVQQNIVSLQRLFTFYKHGELRVLTVEVVRKFQTLLAAYVKEKVAKV